MGNCNPSPQGCMLRIPVLGMCESRGAPECRMCAWKCLLNLGLTSALYLSIPLKLSLMSELQERDRAGWDLTHRPPKTTHSLQALPREQEAAGVS